jgi:RNA polymerase sigma-70 factor, ECF subfamily
VHYKHIKKNPFTKSEEFSDKGKYAINYQTPEMIFEKKEEEKLLHNSIMKLKEPYKQVVILRGLNELSFKEIGEILSESENWSRITFFRGKQKLQEILKGEET